MIIVNDFLAAIGLHDGNSRWYLWWSGMFGNITIFAAAVAIYRKHNCHQPGCWRLQRHAVDGTPYVVCRKHHPDPAMRAKPTRQTISLAHRIANEGNRHA